MQIFNKLFSWIKKKSAFEWDSNFSLMNFLNQNKKDYTDNELMNLYKGWVFGACDSIWDWLAWVPRVIF